jgi:predicted DNA binding CopG/RHH family protein
MPKKRNDSTDYVNWDNAKRVTFPNLRPSMQSISIRLPQSMLSLLKTLANKKDVPYQSLVKIFLAERIRYELRHP